jgi:cell division protein DivIC
MAYKTSSVVDFWWSKLPTPLQNKYLLTLVLFCGWLLFFDKNNVIAQWKLQNKVDELTIRRHFYKEQMVVVQKQIDELLGDSQKLEKYAREQYRMKRDNEDLFVIEETQ